MKKTLATLAGIVTLLSTNTSAFADMLPEEEMYIDGCAIVENTSSFKNVSFIVATYNVEPKRELEKVTILDNTTCVAETGKYQVLKLFAVDSKNISKYAPTTPTPKPEEGILFAEPAEPQDPEKDINAYSIIDPLFFNGSSKLYPLETARTQEYYHRIYNVIGFDNSKKSIGIVLSKEKTAVNEKNYSFDPSPEFTKDFKPETPVFKDIPNNDKYAASTLFLKRNGYVDGYKDGTYKPESTINRAEFTKIVMHDFKSTKDYDCSKKIFKDVSTDSSNWYRDYVCKAYNEGIIVGYKEDNTFRPEQKITFAEASKIILKVEKMTTKGTTDPWYQEFTNYFQEKNILPNTIKSHTKEITRGDMALLIRSIIDPLFYTESASIIDPLFYVETKGIIDPLF